MRRPGQPAVPVIVAAGGVQDADGRSCGRGGQQRVTRRDIEDLVDMVFDDADLIGAAAPGDRRFPGAVRQRPSRTAQVPRRGDPPGEAPASLDLGGDGLAAWGTRGRPGPGHRARKPLLEAGGQGGLPGAARAADQATAPRHHTSVTSTIRICGSAGAPVLAGRPKCAALRDCPPVPLRSLPLGSATLRTVPSLASTRSPCQRPPDTARRQRPQPDRRPLPAGVPAAGRHTAARPGSGTARTCPHSPARIHERPDPQETVRVRQRRRRRQVIYRVGFPGPLRQRPQRSRSRAGHQRPRQLDLHRQPRRDLPRPPPGARPAPRPATLA